MRIDYFLSEKGYYKSRNKAREGIEKGEVFYDGKLVVKPSLDLPFDTELVEIKRFKKVFVSIGGYKLEKALNDFDFKVEGMVCADIGSSTGGFTDCLLSRGAKKVYAVDLNDDLLDESLKTDERVIFLLKNARNLILKDFNESLDFIVGDLSFISLSLIFPVLSNLMKENSFALFLIKPQFELGEKRKLKNGIITDDATRKEILKKVCDYAIKNDLVPQNITTAPIVKGKNVEYLILLKKCKESAIPIDFLINF